MWTEHKQNVLLHASFKHYSSPAHTSLYTSAECMLCYTALQRTWLKQ